MRRPPPTPGVFIISFHRKQKTENRKPSLNCSVCAHPSRPDIDRALENGVPLRSLAGQYGLSPSALHRHTKHLTRRLALESHQEDLAREKALLEKLDLLESRLDRLFRAAEDFRSLHIALLCIRESVRLLSLQEKFRHRLAGHPQNEKIPPP